MTNVAQLLKDARDEPFSESWHVDTELLLMEAMACSRVTLLTWPEREVEASVIERFHSLLQRRREGEPVAYLVGRREFWDFELRVSPAVLIPRPETELLVELAIERAVSRGGRQRIVDLGTGSGAIAIAIARENSQFHVTGVDVSSDALAIARDNAALLADENLDFIEGSWLEDRVCTAIAGSGEEAPCVDILVSNPPYIAPADPHLLQGDLRWEPPLALSCADAGMEAIRQIICTSHRVLKSGAWILLEHGYDQREAVAMALLKAGFDTLECYRDIAGNDRVTSARFNR